MLWRMDKPDRFIKQIQLICDEDDNGCWIWPGCLAWDGDRRPSIKIGSNKMGITRWVLWVKTGEIQEMARHTCDVGCCCNPDHLIWGTAIDNGRDKAERGRAARGEKNPKSKLTEKQVIEIRNSVESSRELSKRFNVNEDTVEKARNGTNWAWLSEEPVSRPKYRNDNRTTSQFLGVYWDKSRLKWAAEFRYNFERFRLGRFKDEIDAAIAYDNKVREILGKEARTNFP